MKTMTCSSMGGPCDAQISASTTDEMMQKGMDHVRAAHPEMVEGIDAMSEAEGKAWNDTFMATWEAAPETAE